MRISRHIQITAASVFLKVAPFLLGLLLAAPATAQVQKVGGVDPAGTTRVVKTDTSGAIAVTTSGTATSTGLVTSDGTVVAGAPTWTVAATPVSASAAGLTAGTCYRVACNAPVFWRTGTGATTALTTDLPLYGPAVEKVCLTAAATTIAFVTAAGTATCVGTLVQ